MDSLVFDNVKAEKSMALRRYNLFRRIGRFFRAAEVCLAILFVFWTFTRLPFAVHISRQFLRRIAGFISTPLFVFLLGNCIVVVLLTKTSDQTTASNAETDIYQALVRSVRSKPSYEEDSGEGIVYEDKEVIVTDLHDGVKIDSRTDSVSLDKTKVYGRSKSDVSSTKKSRDEVVVIKASSLQRWETEKYCRRMEDDKNYPEDNLSNEEFQKTIEAFIAKQLMFRRQESLAVVVHNKA